MCYRKRMRPFETIPICLLCFVMMILVQSAEKPFDFIPPSEPCNPDASTCEFWLHVKEKLTMVEGKKAVEIDNGNLRYIDGTTGPVNVDDVVIADGYEKSRLVYTVNGTLPGPDLIVYKGQTVTLHVCNHLLSHGISMHFHGIEQRDTPWSDGVGFVTQCPIEAGQCFTHKIKITQSSGTHWYHAHSGSQRTMGMYGAFVIRDKPKPDDPAEHVLILQDWNHDWDSDLSYYKMVYGMYDGKIKYNSTDSLDGSHFSLFNFQSGLINGRGRYHKSNNHAQHTGAPLTTYTVNPGSKNRFRVIAAGNLYPFRVSFDNHKMEVVATDGIDIEPLTVDSFVINPGERYDVIITANQTNQNYWIRAKTLEVGVNHVAEAILKYNGTAKADPTSVSKACLPGDKCLVLNCPFRYYPSGENTECILLDELKGKGISKPPKFEAPKSREHFLNFAFPGESGWTPGSVNGRAFKHPTVSPLTQMDRHNWECDSEECGDGKVCACAYSIDLYHQDTVQMVFLNMGSGKGWAHPIHMHGHSFYVMKVGFGEYSSSTGLFENNNKDIDCGNLPTPASPYCNAAKWANSSWGGDNIPGLNLENPPQKDTVMVPSGGYVVVRIKADNPGVWIMHCHIEIHHLDGMAMMLREAKDHIPAPPNDFPTCNSFDYLAETSEDLSADPLAGLNRDAFWACMGGLIVLFIYTVITAITCCVMRKNKKTKVDPVERRSSEMNVKTIT